MNLAPRKIFVIYLRGHNTGGPEALHQLVDMLRRCGFNAYLVPYPSTRGLRRVEQFSVYDAPEAENVEDTEDNIVIAPESLIGELYRVRRAERMCWWLSIDNSPLFMRRSLSQRNRNDPRRSARVSAKRWLRFALQPYEISLLQRRGIRHMAQSSYAWSFLFSRLNVVPSLLSDYTRSEDFGRSSNEPARNPHLVSFNPAKGGDMVAELIKVSDPTIEWRRIENMDRAQVRATLLESGVYLDLGYHPGKDRMPREAALLGALVIVARRGSGAFYGDTPIPWEHKVTPGVDEIANLARSLPGLVETLDMQVQTQDKYRSIIQFEEQQFRREVEDIFANGKFGKDIFDYREYLA